MAEKAIYDLVGCRIASRPGALQGEGLAEVLPVRGLAADLQPPALVELGAERLALSD